MDGRDMKPHEKRALGQAMGRGLMRRCPACGTGRLYSGYLKVVSHCPSCGEALHHHRADDAPPYFTVFITVLIVLPAMIMVEQIWSPPLMIQTPLWLITVLVLMLGLLPLVKGAVVGFQWALRMHGFDPNAAAEDDENNPPAPH
jgi:uncharacterized protein (DUF983 family)